PQIIDECAAAMRAVMPSNRSSRVRIEGGIEVICYSKHWPCLFPQHGPGRKHERAITLTTWQREIVARHTRELLRGLIHSDGSRHLNTVRSPAGKTYAYPRYEFSNRSADIHRIFTDACDLLGIQWRRMNRWNISVARRESVARLDAFIGPKR
ncbi:MAG: helix-turn-helix domain-containing protein, partial [Solirubrobacteraceae bacterium]